jgi:hypothetical protein
LKNFGSGSRQYLVFSKNVYKILLFNVKSNIISQKVGLSFLIFFISFYVGSGSKSGSGTGSGTGMHSGSGSAKAKSYGSWGSGSTTLLLW